MFLALLRHQIITWNDINIYVVVSIVVIKNLYR